MHFVSWMLKLDFIAAHMELIKSNWALIEAATTIFLAIDARTNMTTSVVRGVESFRPLSLSLDNNVLSKWHLELELEVSAWASRLGS